MRRADDGFYNSFTRNAPTPLRSWFGNGTRGWWEQYGAHLARKFRFRKLSGPCPELSRLNLILTCAPNAPRPQAAMRPWLPKKNTAQRFTHRYRLQRATSAQCDHRFSTRQSFYCRYSEILFTRHQEARQREYKIAQFGIGGLSAKLDVRVRDSAFSALYSGPSPTMRSLRP